MVNFTFYYLIFFLFFSQEAKAAICFYKSICETDKDSSVALELEIEKLKRVLGNHESIDNNKNTWTPDTIAIARKALITGVILVALYIFSGLTPMSFYTANIFQETGSNLSPNMSAIVIGVVQLIGTCIATKLVERAGRKVRFYRVFDKIQTLDFKMINLYFFC